MSAPFICGRCKKPGPRGGFLLMGDGPENVIRTPDICHRCMSELLERRKEAMEKDPSKVTGIIVESGTPGGDA